MNWFFFYIHVLICVALVMTATNDAYQIVNPPITTVIRALTISFFIFNFFQSTKKYFQVKPAEKEGVNKAT
jgi:low temperature requirement protein LtrA